MTGYDINGQWKYFHLCLFIAKLKGMFVTHQDKL
jgi:hypothetical protein